MLGKKYEGPGLISEKTEALYTEFNKRAEKATSSYSVTSDLCPWLRIIKTSDQGVSSMDFLFLFKDSNHGYRAVFLNKSYKK